MSTAISIKNLGKSYILKHQKTGGGGYVSLRDELSASFRGIFSTKCRESNTANSAEVFWALDDVSFDVQPGERVGIIGRNGAGKSTLLKIISRITSPTRGRIEITGRVASLLEVGTGFHPELTGRENIFLNGAVLGMSRNDIRRKFDEIVSFAEVERFLDTPVKRYSSGMYMRLAFAVAAHLEPEILVVDEVLAVGDAEFQKKCLGKMREVGQEGRTVLFVSHNMGAISEFCDRAILLNKGNVFADGTPADIISVYSGKAFHAGSGMIELEDDSDSDCSITRIALLNHESTQSSQFDLSETLTIEIDYVVRTRLAELQMAVTVIKEGIDLFQAFDNDDYADITPVEPGSYRLRYIIPARVLKEGNYSIRVQCGLPNKLYQDINAGLGFDVSSHVVNTFKRSFRKDRPGQIISPGTWHKG
ncbi:ABC transporter ATP-binding protein [Herbaspirillum autotrophicum]|uniref:ABC transporter ATP-binding protein n=1 Tax=Herbaspirillum autotrophicum TaxID=180195 RepID=UPI00067D8B57|nr:ABC transporter ATP-binding protein [Herbaspirillum autotrophicum]